MSAAKTRENDAQARELSDTDKETLGAFEAEIRVQEDILYGVALFFEGLSLLHAGQNAIIETYRKHFRNVIQSGNEITQAAASLLDAARENPEKLAEVQAFAFSPCEGYLNPEELESRARTLVTTYEELFPGRPREQQFEESEVLKLIETAAVQLV